MTAEITAVQWRRMSRLARRRLLCSPMTRNTWWRGSFRMSPVGTESRQSHTIRWGA